MIASRLADPKNFPCGHPDLHGRRRRSCKAPCCKHAILSPKREAQEALEHEIEGMLARKHPIDLKRCLEDAAGVAAEIDKFLAEATDYDSDGSPEKPIRLYSPFYERSMRCSPEV